MNNPYTLPLYLWEWCYEDEVICEDAEFEIIPDENINDNDRSISDD